MKHYMLIFTRTKDQQLNDWGLLILRVGIGLLMALAHGWPKMVNFSAYSERFADPFGLGAAATLALAVFSEFFCSLLIIVGAFTRAATIPLIITMLTAVFLIHADDPFNKQELGLLYLVPYLTLLFSGAGRFSVDAVLGRTATPQPQATPGNQ